MLNLLATYERPRDVSVVSGIPVLWNRSRYNQRREAEAALFEVIKRCPAKYVMVSYNSEGFISHDRFVDFDEENKLTEKYYKTVCAHLQIDGIAPNPELLELANLQSYAWIYWTELLYPLSLWSDQKVRKAILNLSV
jgi:hypothetical protein